jgi:cytochrome c oxidase subunit II
VRGGRVRQRTRVCRPARPWPRACNPAAAVSLCAAAAFLAGCHADHAQSVVHPAGPGAEHIARLWWAMLALLGAVFFATMALTAAALAARGPARRRPADRTDAAKGPPLGETRFVVVAGIIVPAVILVAMLLLSLRATVALRDPESDLTIRITGFRWWWHVQYPELDIVTANELAIPVGRPVRLELTSADVIHSFWAPNLTGKMDLIPERLNTFWLQADRPGRYRAQCAEYCGLQHAKMALWVIALPEDQFDSWARDRQRPAPEPDTDTLRLGKEVFFSEPAGCNACHAIRGTDAVADVGPDLTHVRSRLTLGAGTIPNTPETLADWIADPHRFKPGNLMPETRLSPEHLDALVEYLRSLH